ncbi:MAG TPA: CoA pyrophosphatase [Gemmatimonadaceae bacterium]|nr:CoA pyrophosphatase [Gemmatimonadaceae bacterium]
MNASEELDRLAAHPLVVRLIRSLAENPARTVTLDEPARLAAILLALRARADGEPELLMIKRAEAEGDPWSGHIACPGGRMEPGDHDLSVTAVRETLEETGVDIARDGRLLGQLDDISPRTPYLPPIVIRPYVALVRAEVEIVPSEEVAQAFWVPLSALRTPAAWGVAKVTVRGREQEVSVFQHGEYTVWGLTERVLRQLLEYVGA